LGGNYLINLLLCHGILPRYDGLLSASSCVFLISLLHPRAAFFWRESVDDLNSRNLCKRVSVVAEEDRTWKMVEDICGDGLSSAQLLALSNIGVV